MPLSRLISSSLTGRNHRRRRTQWSGMSTTSSSLWRRWRSQSPRNRAAVCGIEIRRYIGGNTCRYRTVLVMCRWYHSWFTSLTVEVIRTSKGHWRHGWHLLLKIRPAKELSPSTPNHKLISLLQQSPTGEAGETGKVIDIVQNPHDEIGWGDGAQASGTLGGKESVGGEWEWQLG